MSAVFVTKVYAYIILHDGHEGSHATVDYLKRRGDAIVPNEFLDQCEWMGCTNEERSHLADIVTRSPRREFEDVLTRRNVSMPHFLDNSYWLADVRSVLVRLSPEQVCTIRETDIRIMLRTDLMRYSLSRTILPNNVAHPQFFKQFRQPHRQYYPVDQVANTARMLTKVWETIAQNILAMHSCGKEVTVINYELLEDSGVLDSRINQSVHRVHSRAIAPFVENYASIYEHFLRTKYPTAPEIFERILQPSHYKVYHP